MLTNRATRLDVGQGHQTWYILYVRYGFLLVCYSKSVRRTVFEIIDFKNAVTLKTGLDVRHGHEMSPFDGARMISY